MKDSKTKRRCDDATERLHAHCPKAHALYKEGKKLAREKRRKDWYAEHGGGK